ncbi:thioredoxin-like protein [Pluteus cervinus]|uniref:Thioredoxin-like protein n=1 Tax=Pluteus cervinus TaxID=181527 RepID=A0ACD3AYA1_9AGAR|nr:thioredoxin-like protein [Pluteus cervinus]
MSFPRRNRLILFLLFLVGFVWYSHGSFELPENLKDSGVSGINRANIVELVKGGFRGNQKPVDEVFGLLYFVTQPGVGGDGDGEVGPGQSLNDVVGLDPMVPLKLDAYASVGKEKVDWRKVRDDVNKESPIVVFSKTYCPYSRAAKELLESYQLQPPPRVIEVDLRDDSAIIKALLTRLTTQSTFPNTFIKGKSIGGSSDLRTLHESKKLKKMLEDAGVTVGNSKID